VLASIVEPPISLVASELGSIVEIDANVAPPAESVYWTGTDRLFTYH